MFKRILPVLILTPLLLTACLGAQQITVSGDTAPTATAPLPTETVKLDPTQTANPTATQPITAADGSMACTLVSSLPDAPDQYARLFAVTADDWVQGPETAAVTLVEYSDFQ